MTQGYRSHSPHRLSPVRSPRPMRVAPSFRRFLSPFFFGRLGSVREPLPLRGFVGSLCLRRTCRLQLPNPPPSYSVAGFPPKHRGPAFLFLNPTLNSRHNLAIRCVYFFWTPDAPIKSSQNMVVLVSLCVRQKLGSPCG